MPLAQKINSPLNLPVLVVDNNAHILEYMTSLLEEYGFSSVACTNSADALAKLESARFGAVITDIKMPGTSGLHLLARIRESSPDLPVILMTAYEECDIAASAVRTEAFDIIMKPYRPDQIIHSIGAALRYGELAERERFFDRALEEAVDKRTGELIETGKATREALSESFAALCRELRAPVLGITDSIGRALTADPSAEQKRYLETILEHTCALLDRISGILDSSGARAEYQVTPKRDA